MIVYSSGPSGVSHIVVDGRLSAPVRRWISLKKNFRLSGSTNGVTPYPLLVPEIFTVEGSLPCPKFAIQPFPPANP